MAEGGYSWIPDRTVLKSNLELSVRVKDPSGTDSIILVLHV